MKKILVAMGIAMMLFGGVDKTALAEDVYIGFDEYMGSKWYLRTESVEYPSGNSVSVTLIDNSARGGSIKKDYLIFKSHRDSSYYYYSIYNGKQGENYYPVDKSSGTIFAAQWLVNNGSLP